MIRPAAHADVSTIAALHRTTAVHAYAGIFPPEAPKPEQAGLERDWAARVGPERPPKQAVFVAEDQGSIVGIVVAGPDPDRPDVGHLSRLYVHPDRWHHGIGTSLHQRAVDHLRAQGYRSATLWVLEANRRTRSWYERRGWRQTARRKAVYAPGGIDDVGYELVLSDQRGAASRKRAARGAATRPPTPPPSTRTAKASDDR